MFDSIMGVGKSPQMTKDVITPLYREGDEVSYLANAKRITLGANVTETSGSPINLVNPAFDYSNVVAYQLTITSGTAGETILDFDLGRVINLRGINLFLTYTRGGLQHIMTVTLQYSTNGTDFINGSSFTCSGSGTDIVVNLADTDKRAKIIRLDLTFSSDAPAPIYNFRRLQIFSSSIQDFTY